MSEPLDEEFDEVFSELLDCLNAFERDALSLLDGEEQISSHFGAESPKDLASFIQAMDDQLIEFTNKTLGPDVSSIPNDEKVTIDEEGLNKSPDHADLTDPRAEELDLLLKATEEELGMTLPSEWSRAGNMDDENNAHFDEAFVKKIEDEIREAEESLMSSNSIKAPEDSDDEDLDPEINEQAMKDFMENESSLRQAQAAPDYTAVQQYLIPLFKNFDEAVAALESAAVTLGYRHRTQDSADTLILYQNLFNLKKAFLKEPTQENLSVFTDMCEKLIVDVQNSRINPHRRNHLTFWLQSKKGVDMDTMAKVREVKEALEVIKLSETPEVARDEEKDTLNISNVKNG